MELITRIDFFPEDTKDPGRLYVGVMSQVQQQLPQELNCECFISVC